MALSKPRLLMLAVGIDRWQMGYPELAHAERNAVEFISFFGDPGTLRHHPDRPEGQDAFYLLGDAATTANILGWLKNIQRKATKQDVVILYWAGHGRVLEAAGSGFASRHLVPYDSGLGAHNSDIALCDLSAWASQLPCVAYIVVDAGFAYQPGRRGLPWHRSLRFHSTVSEELRGRWSPKAEEDAAQTRRRQQRWEVNSFRNNHQFLIASESGAAEDGPYTRSLLYFLSVAVFVAGVPKPSCALLCGALNDQFRYQRPTCPGHLPCCNPFSSRTATTPKEYSPVLYKAVAEPDAEAFSRGVRRLSLCLPAKGTLTYGAEGLLVGEQKLGVCLREVGDMLQVGTLSCPSAAARAGLRQGQKLLTVGGKTAQSLKDLEALGPVGPDPLPITVEVLAEAADPPQPAVEPFAVCTAASHVAGQRAAVQLLVPGGSDALTGLLEITIEGAAGTPIVAGAAVRAPQGPTADIFGAERDGRASWLLPAPAVCNGGVEVQLKINKGGSQLPEVRLRVTGTLGSLRRLRAEVTIRLTDPAHPAGGWAERAPMTWVDGDGNPRPLGESELVTVPPARPPRPVPMPEPGQAQEFCAVHCGTRALLLDPVECDQTVLDHCAARGTQLETLLRDTSVLDAGGSSQSQERAALGTYVAPVQLYYSGMLESVARVTQQGTEMQRELRHRAFAEKHNPYNEVEVHAILLGPEPSRSQQDVRFATLAWDAVSEQEARGQRELVRHSALTEDACSQLGAASALYWLWCAFRHCEREVTLWIHYSGDSQTVNYRVIRTGIEEDDAKDDGVREDDDADVLLLLCYDSKFASVDRSRYIITSALLDTDIYRLARALPPCVTVVLVLDAGRTRPLRSSAAYVEVDACGALAACHCVPPLPPRPDGGAPLCVLYGCRPFQGAWQQGPCGTLSTALYHKKHFAHSWSMVRAGIITLGQFLDAVAVWTHRRLWEQQAHQQLPQSMHLLTLAAKQGLLRHARGGKMCRSLGPGRSGARRAFAAHYDSRHQVVRVAAGAAQGLRRHDRLWAVWSTCSQPDVDAGEFCNEYLVIIVLGVTSSIARLRRSRSIRPCRSHAHREGARTWSEYFGALFFLAPRRTGAKRGTELAVHDLRSPALWEPVPEPLRTGLREAVCCWGGKEPPEEREWADFVQRLLCCLDVIAAPAGHPALTGMLQGAQVQCVKGVQKLGDPVPCRPSESAAFPLQASSDGAISFEFRIDCPVLLGMVADIACDDWHAAVVAVFPCGEQRIVAEASGPCAADPLRVDLVASELHESRERALLRDAAGSPCTLLRLVVTQEPIYALSQPAVTCNSWSVRAAPPDRGAAEPAEQASGGSEAAAAAAPSGEPQAEPPAGLWAHWDFIAVCRPPS
eukprot:TRINITY_DN55502_c0_g1_i1.p1 TRINITY_DN55502_c0_g1~~TRINITY_DN55502_c0_g1_i1.p1  ORF type:complete len:1498 (+),score=350.06 TRINITY_DN55502_c0_g1_i1:397-4494(+)